MDCQTIETVNLLTNPLGSLRWNQYLFQQFLNFNIACFHITNHSICENTFFPVIKQTHPERTSLLLLYPRRDNLRDPPFTLLFQQCGLVTDKPIIVQNHRALKLGVKNDPIHTRTSLVIPTYVVPTNQSHPAEKIRTYPTFISRHQLS